MLIDDIKRGTCFWGRLHQNGGRHVFEGIVMSMERHNTPQYQGWVFKSLIIIVKSNEYSRVGQMHTMFFMENKMEEFFENVNPHFVSMENLYHVLNRYNPTNYYQKAMVIEFDDKQESQPILSLFEDRDIQYAFLILKTVDGKFVQIISLMETCLNQDYENPYVWVNVVENESELLLNEDADNFFDDNYVYTRDNVCIEEANSNQKLNSFFGTGLILNKNAFDRFHGIAICNNSKIQILVFDGETRDDRICYGSGIDVNKESEAFS